MPWLDLWDDLENRLDEKRIRSTTHIYQGEGSHCYQSLGVGIENF